MNTSLPSTSRSSDKGRVQTAATGGEEPVSLQECDLTAQRVMEHFGTIDRHGRVLTFVLALDRMDRWAVDFAELTSPHDFQLQLFLSELARFVHTASAALHRAPAEFAEVLAHLTTSRCLYVMRYLAQRSPHFLEALGDRLESDAAATNLNLLAVRRRLDALERAKLLSEIFSPERLRRIIAIMGKHTE
jgi:hypothetical protein